MPPNYASICEVICRDLAQGYRLCKDALYYYTVYTLQLLGVLTRPHTPFCSPGHSFYFAARGKQIVIMLISSSTVKVGAFSDYISEGSEYMYVQSALEVQRPRDTRKG